MRHKINAAITPCELARFPGSTESPGRPIPIPHPWCKNVEQCGCLLQACNPAGNRGAVVLELLRIRWEHRASPFPRVAQNLLAISLEIHFPRPTRSTWTSAG